MNDRNSLIGLTLASALLGMLTAGGLALPDTATAKDKGHAAAGCPPGLAKKSPACVPPGLAKREYHDDDHVEYDRNHHDGDHAYDRDHDDRFRYSDRYDELYHYRIGDRLRGEYVLIPSPDLYGLDRYGTYYRSGDAVYQVNQETMEILAVIGLASRLLN